ncbi:MAG TPA: lantibiotic immunity ABC transporter MutG family permease subunit [Candidatus Pelethocola excrementipullorum]|nr:lantibiotic immunity ABC transporter MutG family permease subunit [Candidatus Pelethocola excrementipullorum]
MKTLFRYYRAEFYKSRNSILMPLHLILPILLCIAFGLLFYGRRSQISEVYIGMAFFEVMALAFPFIVAIVSGIVVKREEDTSQFQNMRKGASPVKAFGAQLLMLLTIGLGAIIIGMAGLTGITKFIFHKPVLQFSSLCIAGFILWASMIALYTIHLLIGTMYGFGISAVLGMMGTIISAMGITSLGDKIWYYMPPCWGLRLMKLFFVSLHDNKMDNWVLQEYKAVFPVVVIMTLICLVVFFLWGSRWQGRNTQE